ncbi:TFIIS N-terminal domain-containing protein [Pycnococcus provasolii]|uniref:TFIIS N-terminal domain-containing protein n=2 Tax=Pycnococcus provasolii TaxID=41880 RepID=A0A7S2YXT1_9CHLO|mmetsp:Transcript_3112/g.8039  ORF Transcript_3112/g.8039 Transcript_3112/m.8039 type:complete len:148 (+) Transcript_3112:41-484(+)
MAKAPETSFVEQRTLFSLKKVIPLGASGSSATQLTSSSEVSSLASTIVAYADDTTSTSTSTSEVRSALNRLACLQINLDVLERTGVARAVRRCAKKAASEGGDAGLASVARRLLLKWKDDVVTEDRLKRRRLRGGVAKKRRADACAR